MDKMGASKVETHFCLMFCLAPEEVKAGSTALSIRDVPASVATCGRVPSQMESGPPDNLKATPDGMTGSLYIQVMACVYINMLYI